MTGWRDALLADVPLPAPSTGADNPVAWPGYRQRDAVRWAPGRVAGHQVLACVWDFSSYAGSLGERDASAVVAAAARAVELRLPLVTFVRSGGIRLQEGVAALVGIPRILLALRRLSAAGVPHVAVADHPTTGGVWVGVVAGADLRVGVAGATVAFAGPRVAGSGAGSGVEPGPGPAGVGSAGRSAGSAATAGLLDAVVTGDGVEKWLGRALAALAPDEPRTLQPFALVTDPRRSGWAQVRASRTVDRLSGAALLDVLLDGRVELCGGDESVRAVVGRTAAGRRAVGVAVSAVRGGRPTPAGYRLLTRGARLADRLRCGLLTLVDTPGADPSGAAERDGIAAAVAAATTAVLLCAGPTLAVVHGEGGSGGALAATVCDQVLVTPHGYVAALEPEGAAAVLRTTPAEAADLMAVTPADLVRCGFADTLAPGVPADLRLLVGARLNHLGRLDGEERLLAREARWSAPLPGGGPALS